MTVAFWGGDAFLSGPLGRALMERIIFSPVILAGLFHGFVMMYGFPV